MTDMVPVFGLHRLVRERGTVRTTFPDFKPDHEGLIWACAGCPWKFSYDVDRLRATEVWHQDPRHSPSVPPSSAVQGSVRTEGPDAGPEAQTGFLVQHSGAGPATVWPVTIGPAQPAEGFLEREPSVESRLRSLATAELEAAKGGSRIQKAAAKAAARAYRLAAEMIEEEQA